MVLSSGHRYAVSVTPAITIVLAALLGSTASLQTSWSGFETIVALDELFKLVREGTGDEMPPFQILQLDNPYDARTGSRTLEVPEMTRSMVLINGSKAAYADVIAPFRLLQAKHCKSRNSPAKLYLEEELRKMGVLKTSSSAQKVFAGAQYEIWQDDYLEKHTPESQLAKATVQVSQQAVNVPDRSLYPACLMVSEVEKKKQLVGFMRVMGRNGIG